MPRRIAMYPHSPQWKTLNDLSTFGAILVGISMIVFVVNVGYSWKKYRVATTRGTPRPSSVHHVPRRTTTSIDCPRSALNVRRGTTTTRAPVVGPRNWWYGTHHEPPLANAIVGALEHDQDHDA